MLTGLLVIALFAGGAASAAFGNVWFIAAPIVAGFGASLFALLCASFNIPLWRLVERLNR